MKKRQKVKVSGEDLIANCPDCGCSTSNWMGKSECINPDCGHVMSVEEIKESIDEQMNEAKRSRHGKK